MLSSAPYYPTWTFAPFAISAVTYTFFQRAWVSLSHPFLPPRHPVTAGNAWLALPLPDQQQFSSSTTSTHPIVAIVTGSNTGIGFETAKRLAVVYGMTVILACRSRDKAERAAQEINRHIQQQQQQQQDSSIQQQQRQQGKAIFVHPLDLCSFESIHEFVQHVKQDYRKIHVLVNNAGRNTSGESPQHGRAGNSKNKSLDLLFQANFVGHYLLTAELLPLLQQPLEDNTNKNDDDNEVARIVNLSSVMHHYCGDHTHELHQVDFWHRVAGFATRPTNTYALSKLAAVLFTVELNRRYYNDQNPKTNRVRSVAVNPGGVNSDIWRSFPKLIQWIQSYIYLTNAQGCETTVAAATCRSRDIGDSIYLQPYPLQLGPWDTMSTNRPAFPPLEMLGPFVGGARRTTPRLPNPDRSDQAAAALWQACHELTKADWKSPPASSS